MKRICKLLTLLLALALICTGCAGGAMRGNAFTVYTNPTDYQGVVFENGGMASEISWRKDASSSTLAFYDANGKQLTLSVGNTYIGLLKSSSIESIVIK